MSYWRSCLLISWIVLSGCALNTGSKTNTSAAPAASGHSQIYAYTTPRNTVPGIHQPGIGQTPLNRSSHVGLLSPRMHGFYAVNPTIERVGGSASKANSWQSASPAEGIGHDNAIIAQPAGSKTAGQVIVANVFPVFEPHYAGPIAAVLFIGALIYYALYRFAGSGQQMAQTKDAIENPVAKGNPVTYHTNTQINYHYDTDGEKMESRREDPDADKGRR